MHTKHASEATGALTGLDHITGALKHEIILHRLLQMHADKA